MSWLTTNVVELAPEDALRINVLLANQPQAIRIDESRMFLYGLTDSGEVQIQLNPTCRDEQYLKHIRELLSNHYLGSPAGFPVTTQRWARMGQNRIENLDGLLLLGEPSAVIAVVYAEGLSDDLARRAWWAMEDAENARQMLRVQAVVEGEMAPRLATYLIEFLPFETETEQIMETVRLVLQPGLISGDARQDLWRKARRKSAMYVGFLAALPHELPGEAYPHPEFAQVGAGLKTLAERGNELAGLLYQILSVQGQLWLDTLGKILEKPGNQDVVNWTLDVIAGYFNAAAAGTKLDYTVEQLMDEAEIWVDNGLDEQVTSVLAEFPRLKPQLQALRVLSGAGYNVVRPVFSKSTAIGSLMRRQLEPVLTPLKQQLDFLQ
jgi:hypothetical protein